MLDLDARIQYTHYIFGCGTKVPPSQAVARVNHNQEPPFLAEVVKHLWEPHSISFSAGVTVATLFDADLYFLCMQSLEHF